MNKTVTTSGLALLGVAGLPAVQAAETLDASRWWSVSAAVRAFYDDNYLSAPKPADEDSWGLEVRPSIDARWVGEQTTITASYLYSMKYFFDRDDDEVDQSHYFDVVLAHEFSERSKIKLSNSLVYTQEPDLAEEATALPLRSELNNLRNLAEISYDVMVTRLLGLSVGYKNVFYDYGEDGDGSFSALLDRVEHYPRIDTRWVLSPTLTGVVGYQFGITSFDGDYSLYPGFPNTGVYDPTIRDSETHYLYGGVDAIVNPQASVSLRVGAANTDYTENPLADSEWNPYADASFIYNYLEGSFVQIGARYAKNRTDLTYQNPFLPGLDASDLTLDQDTATGYLAINHKITERLTASLTGQAQYGEFNGGAYDGEADGYYTASINLLYMLNNYFGVEAGYNYDRLDSDLSSRSYTRNRVYFGIRGTY
jgi:hypothetical protein